MKQSQSGSHFDRTSSGPRHSLLARVADASYWLSRYMERSEHLARILLVSADVLTGAGDLDEAFADQICRDVLVIAQQEHRYDEWKSDCRSPVHLMHLVARHMVLDRDNPNSLVNCITKARENARSIRESISAEMWEHINTLYWSINAEDAAAKFEDVPQEVYRQVMTGSLLFQGLTDQTLDHGQVWLFIQLSKYLERVDMTCRILSAKFNTLHGADVTLEAPLRVIQWMAVLRTCCSIEAFRRINLGEIEATRVAEFIIFEPSFPRSVLFCIRHALDSVDRIRAMLAADAGREAQRQLGRLLGELQYSQAVPTPSGGMVEFLEATRSAAAAAATAVQDHWFLRAADTGRGSNGPMTI